MHLTLRPQLLIGLAAAAGAFGAAAMLSAAVAPAAHADDFTDILANVQGQSRNRTERIRRR